MIAKILYCSVITCCLLLQVAATDCNFDIKLTQTLLNEGFHRNLSYDIVFKETDEGLLYSDCIIGLDQTLPPGVFVNPDELYFLKKQKKINAIVKNRVNIEEIAEKSSSSNVFIIGIIRDNEVSLWIPLHARYHAARAEGGKVRNKIDRPKLYLRCPDGRLNECDNSIIPTLSFLCSGMSKKNCSWKELWFTTTSDIITWDIPVGNTDHYYLVTTGTALVIIIGSLYLLKSIHHYKISLKKKK